ncbi:MAG: hypothetical protein V4712_13915 [Pseudomonadota bacterium]
MQDPGDRARHDPDLPLVCQALSDPTRRAMLAQIGGGRLIG